MINHRPGVLSFLANVISLEHDIYFFYDFLCLLTFGVYLLVYIYDQGHCMLHVLALFNNIFLKDIGLLLSISLCRVVLRKTSNKMLSCLVLAK